MAQQAATLAANLAGLRENWGEIHMAQPEFDKMGDPKNQKFKY